MELSMWKEEPLSPVYSGLELDQSDVWQLFEEDDVAKQKQPAAVKQEQEQFLSKSEVSIWLPDSPDISCEYLTSDLAQYSFSDRAQLASQLLRTLEDDEYIKDEPYSEWLEQKVEIPIFEDLPSPAAKEDSRPLPSLESANVQQFASFTPASSPGLLMELPMEMPTSFPVVSLPSVVMPAPADTQVLLQEFECVFGKVEQSHGALTPPQSPPHATPEPSPAAQTFHRLLPVEYNEASAPLTPNPELIAEVDEIVRSRVEEESWADSEFRPPSPCTSSSSSSYLEAASSPETLDSDSADDPEWIPSPSPSPSPSPASPPQSSSPGKIRGRKRAAGKPYSSSVEDKRLRKKEQNKNAATRYRMKKKAEVEEILGEEQELKDKNDELQAKVADLSQEIRYLKNLMRDVFKAKGLIK